MKKIPVQIEIGLLMIMAVILITATGYLSYRNLSSVVSSIEGGVKPESRLLAIREISMDLEKAQNSLRIYTATNNQTDLKPYYRAISRVDSKVNSLRSEYLNDITLVAQIDTIKRLIDENKRIWNKLIYLNDNQKVDDYLKRLSDTLTQNVENEASRDNNLLNRIFGSRKKSTLNEKELLGNLREIRQQDSINKKLLSKREAQLAATGIEIKEKFYDLINKTEYEISAKIKEKASAADDLAEKTYIWLGLFSVSGTLLAIMVMLIIVRYIRKTQAYQVALQNSKDESDRLTRMKELFMANISHEIRTPVTAISGFTEQLLNEPLDENISRKLRIIKSSSDHLAGVINDILDFSKLQNGSVMLEQIHFRIRVLPEEVFAMFEHQALLNNTSLNYSVTPDTPDVLLGDPYRLKQIIINLVSNSIKFTKNGNVLCAISANIKQLPEIELVLEVTDTGIGIDESRIGYIFDDFTQEEMSTSRKYGGTGLGLSIVKKLTELQKGRIEVKSKKDSGTSIVCTIPFQTGDEKKVRAELTSPVAIPQEVKNLKILVVDDHEYIRMLFRNILDRWSAKHLEVAGGMEAIEVLKKEKFNLLFMDARMPGMDGLQTTMTIRDELGIEESEMPVICISAANTNEDRDKYRIAGMNAFLSKPFTEESLLTAILSVNPSATKQVKSAGNTVENIHPISGSSKIDLKNLYHISGGDEQFVRQMLDSFIDTTKKGINELKEALSRNRTEQAADLAHKLVPPCRHIGATDLSALLKEIEVVALRSDDKNLTETLVTEAAGEFDLISEIINDHISNHLKLL